MASSFPIPCELINRAELFALLRVGRTAGYEIIKRDDFPRPFDLNGRNLRVWDKAQALAWVASQPRRPVGEEPSHLAVTRVRDGKVVSPKKHRSAEATR
jgi:predicted DNA-binding transcriptional regulator AlpA